MLPLLLGDRIVARIDLKSDRAHSQLQVRGGSLESDVAIGEVMAPLRRELQRLARWLSLETVQITSRRGELMRALRAKSA